ncbi:MAG TPA: hypothetical protein VLU43_12810 [Anaeromyxobacteraceae bacterium]|nr:hypothetical protein [Anaeromyxobacteraceae bacterium]
MQVFSRRGYQLRTASFETRLAYTGFLTLVIPGVASLLALSLGRVGISPRAVAAYYRGGESEMTFPKQLWQLVEVSHFHLFTIPVVLLILSHLLIATPLSSRARAGLTGAMFGGAALEMAGPWAVRYLAAGFAWVLVGSWLLLAGAVLASVAVSLAAMWGPERWWSVWLAASQLGNGAREEEKA